MFPPPAASMDHHTRLGGAVVHRRDRFECGLTKTDRAEPLDEGGGTVHSCRQEHPQWFRKCSGFGRTAGDTLSSSQRTNGPRVLLLMPPLRCAHIWGTFGRCAGCLLSTSRSLLPESTFSGRCDGDSVWLHQPKFAPHIANRYSGGRTARATRVRCWKDASWQSLARPRQLSEHREPRGGFRSRTFASRWRYPVSSMYRRIRSNGW